MLCEMILRILGYGLIFFLLHRWPTTLFATGSATDVIVIEFLNTTIVCERCRPGYQTSELCLKHFEQHSFKRIKEEKSKSSRDTNFSRCAACASGTFSDTFFANQTCKICKICGTGYGEERQCNTTSDTKCKIHYSGSSGSGNSKVIWLVVIIAIFILFAFGACWFFLRRKAFYAEVKLNRPDPEEQELELNNIP